MPFGDPDGLRIIDQPNWSGIAVAFPRGAYRDVSKRTEFARMGIYILVGSSAENGPLPTLYIGQSDKISSRLDTHLLGQIWQMQMLRMLRVSWLTFFASYL